jgi:hypothetical protein
MRMALQPAFRQTDFGAAPVAPKRTTQPGPRAREDTAEQVADAFQRGLAEGRAQGLATLAERLEEERARVHAHLEAEQRARLAEHGEALGCDLARGLAELQEAIAEAVAAVLEPWLKARASEAALTALRAAVDRALAGEEGLTIRATGPCELVEALGRTLAEQGHRVVVAPGERPELRLTFEDTRIELATQAWLRRMEEDAA